MTLIFKFWKNLLERRIRFVLRGPGRKCSVISAEIIKG